jgi:hypothetical protein
MAWSVEDRDLALAYSQYEGSICPRCGTSPSDWLDEEGKLKEPAPYRVQSTRCHGCATLEETRGNLPKKDPKKLGERLLEEWTMR